ncbi:MAG: DUF4139 domain-containing protein [Flavobacteriales bacterium]|nr:DUF4139 domain-containing protein [Flavobacteriales bacterium]
MRSALVLLFVVLLANLVHAAEGEKPITSKVAEVKVFLSGAQVSRAASATVPTGTSNLVFTGLAEGLDPQSIQVTGKGGYQILSVNHRINYLTESPKKKEIEDLMARIKKLEKDHAYEKAMQDVWVNEEQLLGKNSSVGGQQNGLTAAQLTAVNDYVRQRLIATKTNWLTQQEKLVAINEELQKQRQQLQQLQAQAPRPTSEVVVEISSSAEVSASFVVTYFIGQSGWIPAYDLRAKGVGQPIELLMKAQVTNGTGEDWSKVALSLSSGNPTLGGIMPTLNPWTLYTYRPRRETAGYRTRAADGDFARQPAPAQSTSEAYKLEGTVARQTVENTVAFRTTTVEFVIETPFTIPADGVAHTVGVNTHSIAATYKHYATPKLDKDAFLYARTTGWESLNLLPGEANVFFEGTFVGQSYLELDMPKDTLDISLGRDKGVVVERVKRKTTNEKAIVGGKRTVTIGWDLTVRNTKGTAVDLEVRDQYPLSPQSEIEVKLKEDGGATVDNDKGALTWTLKLESKATRKLGFSYEVKHPKDMPVVLE